MIFVYLAFTFLVAYLNKVVFTMVDNLQRFVTNVVTVLG